MGSHQRREKFPYCETVLLYCALSGISPEGWGEIGGETMNVHYWEFNSTRLTDGKPVDISRRHPVSCKLTSEKDSETINNYMNPAFILSGWNPAMAPIILDHPEEIQARTGQTIKLTVKSTVVPSPSYQWFKNDKPVSGAVHATLTIKNIKRKDTGRYKVLIENIKGNIASDEAMVTVED